MTHIDIIKGILIALVVIILWRKRCEGYATKKEKADTLFNWFSRGDNKYADYKKEVRGSDIVEYNKISVLKRDGKLSAGAIESLI